MSIKRLFDAVERRDDIGRRVAALVLPISNRARVTSGCAGKIGLREPGEYTSGSNLASRDKVAHSKTLIKRSLNRCHIGVGRLEPGTSDRRCSGEPNIPVGASVDAGLDLGATRDRSDLVIVRQDGAGVFHVKPYCWLPGGA
jgi:hypothetical protein